MKENETNVEENGEYSSLHFSLSLHIPFSLPNPFSFLSSFILSISPAGSFYFPFSLFYLRASLAVGASLRAKREKRVKKYSEKLWGKRREAGNEVKMKENGMIGKEKKRKNVVARKKCQAEIFVRFVPFSNTLLSLYFLFPLSCSFFRQFLLSFAR